MVNQIRKNLLDLKFNKYLSYYNTTVIILFTYFIAVLVSVISGQIILLNLLNFLAFLIVSLVVISFCLISLARFKRIQRKVILQIANLEHNI